jgi:hypothetical protein
MIWVLGTNLWCIEKCSGLLMIWVVLIFWNCFNCSRIGENLM